MNRVYRTNNRSYLQGTSAQDTPSTSGQQNQDATDSEESAENQLDELNASIAALAYKRIDLEEVAERLKGSHPALRKLYGIQREGDQSDEGNPAHLNKAQIQLDSVNARIAKIKEQEAELQPKWKRLVGIVHGYSQVHSGN